MKFNDLADLEILKECLAETDLASNDNEPKIPLVEEETDLVLPEDKEIRCINCGKTFTFTVGEQEFYKSKNFPFPKRCKKCSKKRRLKFLNYKQK